MNQPDKSSRRLISGHTPSHTDFIYDANEKRRVYRGLELLQRPDNTNLDIHYYTHGKEDNEPINKDGKEQPATGTDE